MGPTAPACAAAGNTRPASKTQAVALYIFVSHGLFSYPQSRARTVTGLVPPSEVAKLSTVQGVKSMIDLDMRKFAENAGVNITVTAGNTVFVQGESGNCMYVVQSGVIEMVIGDTVVEVCGPNEALGFMSVIDQSPRSSTARVRQTAQLSIIDQRKFRFMVDEVPNFAMYVMSAMARRIRGMSNVI